MKLTVTDAPLAELSVQVLVIPVFEKGDRLDAGVAELMAATRFTGAAGESVLSAWAGRADAVYLLGLGTPESVDRRALSLSVAATVRDLSRFETIGLAMPAGMGSARDAVAVADGVLDGWYLRPGSKASQSIEGVSIVIAPGELASARAAVADAVTIGESIWWARELIDASPGDLTPSRLASAAVEMGAETGLSVRIRQAEQLRAEGFGGILAVGGGSANPPCLIEARHAGAGATTIGLVGKGITFDAGGLYLKTGAQMLEMKSDMAGAASMLATARAAALLGLPVGVHVAAPAAENLPSGTSYKPGDVIRHYGGRTSEVADTDAEGRVVLADALAYLASLNPAAIVDSATLTYDVIKALGDQIGGVLGTDDRLVEALVAAGERVGEPWWQLPLWPGYRTNIDSPVADVRNDGGSYADAIHAALFLAEFTDDVPWAHLDIAGTAFRERASSQGPAGATGFSIRTLITWLRTL